MKTVSGEIISTSPISLAKASSKVLSKFVTVDDGTSPAIGIYLRKASGAFNVLVQFHKGISAPKCDRKSRKASSSAESVNITPREMETEGARGEQRKHKHREKKTLDGDNGDGGLVEASQDLRRTAKQELANGNGKFLGPKSEKRKRKKLKGEFGSAKDGIIENGEVNAISNGAEDVDGKKKKRGDVSMRIGEDGTVKEGRRGGWR